MATLEQLVLDGLALNDVTNYRLQAFDPGNPKKRYEWATGADADGAALIRDPLVENREIQARIRINQRTTMDAALAAVGAIVDKLEEAEKQPDGLDLVWTPANGTKSFTFKVLSGEITGLPVSMDGDDAGWFKNSPVLNVTLTCKPYGYGPEVSAFAGPTSSATPFVTLTLPSVPGDVPAEGRLIVTDAATQARRYMEWGLEQRYYDAATSLLVDSDNMVVTGTAGAQTTRTGAYDPNATGNNVIRATLWRGAGGIAATGNLGHVGTYRVKARVYGSGTGRIYARLAWQEGDGPYRSNPFVEVHLLGTFVEIDLGIISIPTKDLGTQRWSGRIEAASETVGDTLDVDYLVLVPAGEGYGKARAVGSTTASAAAGYDDFATLTNPTVLNARTAPAGGAWSTSGATTDFVGAVAPAGTAARQTISDASPRFAVLGTTNFTDVQTEIWSQYQSGPFIPGVYSAAVARYVDSNNYVFAQLLSTWPGNLGFTIGVVVAGTMTLLGQTPAYYSPNVMWGIRLTAYASGTVIGELRAGTSSAQPQLVLRGSSSAVATGGTLATGKPGFFDHNSNTTAVARIYDFFSVSTPTAEPIVINSSRAIEVRSDGTIRADSTNTYWGPAPAYRGSRFMIPPAGDENRTSRILAKAHRQDIESADAANVTDNLTVQVNVTPRYLAVPR